MPYTPPDPEPPSLFYRVAFIALISIASFIVGACLMTLASCSPAASGQVKPILRQVDEHVQLACEGLAQALAERSGADVQRIVATTCAVEGVTRLMRELLLSQQIEAAKAAGVAVPSINSGSLEPDPYRTQDAE